MNHSDETIEGFVIRCYSDEFSRGNYAGIIGDIGDSIEDVADAIVEYLEEHVVNATDRTVWNESGGNSNNPFQTNLTLPKGLEEIFSR